MTKRKSKTTEFKPPKRTQPRAKRQRSAEETNRQSADETEIQTPQSENNNSHNASCTDELDEHQPGQNTLQICQTTEFPSCSMEEKTRNDEDGSGTNPAEVPHEIQQTTEISVQTTEPNNNDNYNLSRPLNVDDTHEKPPDVKLVDEESEIATNSNHESEKVADESEFPSDECQTERELSHEESIDTEPKVGERLVSSDITAETSVDETMTEDADPTVKRKIRKRMGMCRLGERKRMLKGQPARGNVFGGEQENEAGQVINVMWSDDLNKDASISLEEEGTTESEVSASSFPTSCPLEDIPVQEDLPGVQYVNEVQILVECMSSEQEISHETHNTITDDPLEKIETECVEHSTNESNIGEYEPGICEDVTSEIGTEVTVDLAEVCKEDVLAQDEVVIEGPLELLKEAAKPSASTSEVGFEELIVVGGSEMEVEERCPSERDAYTSISDHTNEQRVDPTDIAYISTLPVMNQMEDKCESLDCTLVAAAVTPEKNTVNCEVSSIWSLSLPATPPCGEENEVHLKGMKTEPDHQSVTEHDGLLSDAHPGPAAQPDPSSPLSIDSVTDSQLNNIPLSLEDLLIPEDACDLEDATELVCGLIRDLSSLNQIVRDAHRKIGPLQQGRKPPRPQFHCIYGPPH